MSTAALIRQAKAAGISLRLEDGKIRYRGSARAVASLLESLRQNKADLLRWFAQESANDSEPLNNPTVWRELHEAYLAHHWNCPTCRAAGRSSRYGLRCGAGAALWSRYVE